MRDLMPAVVLAVVAGQGGNAGIQSPAAVMGGIVMQGFPADRNFPLNYKEGNLSGLFPLIDMQRRIDRK